MRLPLLALCSTLSGALVAQAEVQMDEFTLHDARRDRHIECRSYAPKAGHKLPLIVFSHGFGANRTTFAPIAQHWAEHGYVVIAPSHLDGAGKSKGQGNPVPTAGLPALMAHAALKTENRVRDVTFILDALELLQARVPSLRGRIDSTRMGVARHSLGACSSAA